MPFKLQNVRWQKSMSAPVVQLAAGIRRWLLFSGIASAASFSTTSTVSEGFLSSEEDAPTEPKATKKSAASETTKDIEAAGKSSSEAINSEQTKSDSAGKDKKASTASSAQPAAMPTAVVWYLEMAKNGDVEAQYNLGSVYETGFGVPVNKKEAARWYEKAAEQDHHKSQLKLGIMYVLGDGVRQSMIKGSRWIRKSSDNGNEFAKNLYEKVLSPDAVLETPATEIITKLRSSIDLGPKKSSQQLIALLKKQKKKKEKPELKERFTGPAKNTLGKEVKIANNVPEFLEKKQTKSNKLESDNLALLHREANAGNPQAQYQLGIMYNVGDKVARDPAKAMTWFTSAANQNHPESQYKLAVAYIFGIGTKRNPALGEDWLTKAAQQNHPVAKKMLPMYTANRTSAGGVSIALHWYLEKAINGGPEGEFGIGHMYENGWGVASNFNEARKWYAAARQDGSGGAAKRLRQIKATSASNDPTPEVNSAPKMSNTTREQFSSTLTVAGSNKQSASTPSNTGTAATSDKRVVTGTLPTRSNAQSQTTNFSPKKTDAQQTSSPVFTTATVTRRSPLTPIILIVFGLIMGITVFKWMRRGSYKKQRYAQTPQFNRGQPFGAGQSVNPAQQYQPRQPLRRSPQQFNKAAR